VATEGTLVFYKGISTEIKDRLIAKHTSMSALPRFLASQAFKNCHQIYSDRREAQLYDLS
jgi:hypothetical protein